MLFARRDTAALRRLAALAAFPLAVVVVFLALVAGNLNGSSIGIFHVHSKSDPALLAGTPREVRSDEFAITTPVLVSSARQGFPSVEYVGLTATPQAAVPHGGATHQWVEIFKPQDWGYLALGAGRGLAWDWWWTYLVPLIGVYLLLLALGFGSFTSAALAVAATMTPYAAWWTSTSPALIIGYAALAGAAWCRAMTTAGSRARAALGVLAGVALTADALTLYPPWVLPITFVVAAAAVGFTIDVRAGWRRILVPLGGLAVVSTVALAIWYVQNRQAIHATAATIYPGHRFSKPGEAVLAYLLDAPLNPLFAGSAGASLRTTTGSTATNLSETSSAWLPLPLLLVAVAIVAVLWWRRSGDEPARAQEPARAEALPDRWRFVAVTVAFIVLIAWAVLPLPGWTGSFLLDRVKGTRVPPALGLASLLMLGFVGRRGARRPRLALAAVWGAAVLATVALTVWSARNIPWDQSRVPFVVAAGLGLVVAVALALIGMGWGQRVGAGVLAVFAFWSWALVNPLYHGLGPFQTDRLVTTLRTTPGVHPGDRVEVFGSGRTIALVRAAGLQSLAGVTFYPNVTVMSQIAPQQRPLWNNFVKYTWIADPNAPEPIHQVHGTSMELNVSPCEPQILALGVRWAVAEHPLAGSCLQAQTSLRTGAGHFYIYRVSDQR